MYNSHQNDDNNKEMMKNSTQICERRPFSETPISLKKRIFQPCFDVLEEHIDEKVILY